ncbi:MAG: hypothetical protein RR623_08510 [Bacilli bacterium]
MEIVEQGTVGTDTYIKYADGRMEQEIYVDFININFNASSVPYSSFATSISFVKPFINKPLITPLVIEHVGAWFGGIDYDNRIIKGIYMQCIISGIVPKIKTCLKISGYWK